MFEDDVDSARNLKLILCIFEQLTGLKINFRKLDFGRIAGWGILPRLYYLTFSQNITVNKVFTQGFDCIKFRRFLIEETKSMWLTLLNLCSQVS